MRTYGILMAILLVLASVALVAMTSLGTLAQQQSKFGAGCGHCYQDQGALAAGIELAMTYSMNGQHDMAQQAARDALTAAHYRCTVVPDGSVDSKRVRLRCEHE